MSKKTDSSGLEALTFKTLEKHLAIDRIDISAANVRKEKPRIGLEELKGSMGKIGLVHPVIVLEKEGGRYDLIVGQRRFRAAQDLGWKDIAALVIEPLNDVSKSVVSLGENLHRRDLPYSDTIEVCRTLFKQYDGSSAEKIDQTAATLGLSRRIVIQYLGYDLVPKEVKDLVEEKKLKPKKAAEITAAFWPNKEKIASVAREVVERRLTDAEYGRVLDIGSEKPTETVDNVIQQAKKPPPLVEILITMPRSLATALQDEATHRNTTINDLVIQSVQVFLKVEKD
jgi:ParB family transcriptional regulator, chromosome partitioning protein